MLWDTTLLAIRALRRNVLRSSLTTLGIVIGVAAVITMVTIGGGATAKVAADIASLGSNLLNIRPGQMPRGPGGARTSAKPFKIKDAEAIAREISGLAGIAATASKGALAIFANQNWSTSVTGSDNAYLAVRNWRLQAGRAFTDSEVRAGKMVCLLGATVRKQLFGGQDPLDATIRLGKLSCQVIGVLQARGQSGFGADEDNVVLVPLRAFQRRIAGKQDVDAIFVSARTGAATTKVQQDVESLLRERRRIGPHEEDDFNVMDMQEVVSTVTGATRVLTGLLGAVAAVSLLVGGIGIMNIMMVSVTERTREIGTRLAIGALEREVLLQFLVEAVVLSLFGGLIGIGVGLAAAAAGVHALGVPFVWNIKIIITAFVFSGAVGVGFGYFPARQAARLDPIEALRHE
jgi:putative ABC transport system permease protein